MEEIVGVSVKSKVELGKMMMEEVILRYGLWRQPSTVGKKLSTRMRCNYNLIVSRKCHICSFLESLQVDAVWTGFFRIQTSHLGFTTNVLETNLKQIFTFIAV